MHRVPFKLQTQHCCPSHQKKKKNTHTQKMKRQKLTDTTLTTTRTTLLVRENPFEMEDIIYKILNHLNSDTYTRKSLSLVNKSFHKAESRHRTSLRPLRPELLPRILTRYTSLTQLDFSLCPRIQDSTLTLVSSTCNLGHNLRSINLSRSKAFTKVGLGSLVGNCVNLVEIDLSNGTELTDLDVKVIGEGAKNLESLWLTRCKRVTDMGIGCVAVGCRKLKLLSLKWCIRVSDLGVKLLAIKCKDLRTLDLSYLPVTEKCLPKILQLQYLENLILQGCLGFDDDGLASLKQSHSSLKTLNMSHCQNVSHKGLSFLTKGAKELRQLNLAYSPSVTFDLGKYLRHFLGLQSIMLDGCQVTCSGLKAIGSLHTSLVELSLSKCEGVTDECLTYLVQMHKDLKKLNVTCCRSMTSASVDSITRSCPYLISLKMESCGLVATEAFILVGERCLFLEELDVTDTQIDDSALKSISRCSRLTSLKLGICLKVTDEGLVHVGKGCSKLKELDLYRCAGVSDVGVAAIARGCPDLEIINFAYNAKITDDSLISLSKCLMLKELEMRACSLVSSAGLSAIALGCRQLTVIDMKKCLNINDNGMLALAQNSRNLKQINLSYSSVTDVGLLALCSINRLQNMVLLHLVGLSPSGLAAALLTSTGLIKVKLHSCFQSLLPQNLIDYMTARGCVFHWRDKPFQVNVDPKGWNQHLAKIPGAP